MPTRRPFKRQDKIKMLLWCARRCCLCEERCGIDIEIAHIGDPGDNSCDNGVPVCYGCHAKMGAYNDKHPRGSKITIEEIKASRELVYEKNTRPHLAPIEYRLSQLINPWDQSSPLREFPDVTFAIGNRSEYLATKLHVTLLGYVNKKPTDLLLEDGLYSGGKVWHLNPGRVILGRFYIRNDSLLRRLKNSDRLEVRVRIIQEDAIGRVHTNRLEDGYVCMPDRKEWYFEP